MIGEYKGRNQIVFNEEALQRNNNEGHENKGRNQKVLNEVTLQRDNNMEKLWTWFRAFDNCTPAYPINMFIYF